MNYLDMIDPSDPMSVLVAADWLEESGHITEANALRALSPPSDSYGIDDGYGDGYGYGFGNGFGDGDGDGFGDSCGDGDGDGYGDGNACVYGYGYGDGDGDGYGDGDGCGSSHVYDHKNANTIGNIGCYLLHARIFTNRIQSAYMRNIHESH